MAEEIPNKIILIFFVTALIISMMGFIGIGNKHLTSFAILRLGQQVDITSALILLISLLSVVLITWALLLRKK